MTGRTRHTTGPGIGPQRAPQRPPSATPARRDGRTPSRREAARSTPAAPVKAGADRSKLTLAEVCAELGIERSTFYDWRAKNRAPRCLKLPNGQLRIRRVDLDDWLESLSEGDV